VAEASKTIELIFQGIDKTAAATQSALSNVEKFSGGVQNVTQPIADFTVGALKLEAGLLAAGAAILAFSVKSAADFDSAFRQISTIIDASDADLGKFKQSILDYASTSTQPLEKITNALANAIGSGVDYAQSLSLLSTAEKLAVATRSDLDGTTKVLVSTLNSYGLSIDQAGKVSDVFFKIIDEGDIGMADLANSFAKVAPIAKISGVSIEEVGAAIATLTASGIKPAESIEYLRGAISNIISPSGQAKDLAEELGLQFNAAGLKADGLAGLLQKVATATGGSADKLKVLFGDIGGFTAAATLAGPQAQKFAETLSQMGNVAGATDDAFKKVTGSLEVSGAKIASAFNALAVSIGQPLLDEFGGVANAIAGIFQALGASAQSGALGELVDYIEKNLKDLQGLFEAVARNLPQALAEADFSGFKRGLDAVLSSVKGLFGEIDLSTVDGLKSAIQAVGGAFLALSGYVSGVIESLKPMFDFLVRVGQGLESVDLEAAKSAGNFGGLLTQINFLTGGLNALLALLIANQGIGLLGAFRSLATIGPVLTTAMAGLGATALAAAPAIAAAIAAYAGTKAIVDAYQDLKAAEKQLQESQEFTAQTAATVKERLAEFTEQTGIVVSSLDEALALVDDGTVVWDEATKSYFKAGDALRDVGDAVRGTINPFEEQNRAILEAAANSKEAALAAASLKYEQAGLLEAGQQIVPIIDAATGAITGYERGLTAAQRELLGISDKNAKAGDSLDKVAKKTKEAEDSQRRWNEELRKMEHAERLKLIESQTQITTAQLEADAKKITAAFESINTTVVSTGTTLASLFSLFKDYNSMDWSQIRKIEQQIDRENKARDDALNMQSRLIEAQIKEITARTAKLESGDALIKIDGSGLKPHLEAFMWEILRAIQTRVSRDGLELLVGV
jgi:TP901 family phage tail tape measure protein